MSDDGEVAPYYRQLFEKPENPEANSTFSKVFYRGLGALTGMTLGFGRNYRLGRPWSAGLPFTVMCAAGLSVGGEFMRRMVKASLEYDLRRTYHYIMTHPEDFPEPQRLKYSEVFQEWEVVR